MTTQDSNDLDPGQRIHKSDALASSLHEARRPVALIRGYLEILLHGSLGALTADQQTTVERIDGKVTELAELLENVETAARIDGGLLQLDDVDVMHELARAVSRANGRAEVLAADITVDPSPAISASADRRLLGRILDNLIDNALTYTVGHPHVRIAAQRAGTGATVRVTDEGIGVSASASGHLFERSFREHPEDDARQGWGLGLYLSQRAAEAMGGRLWLESSAPGRGSTFRLDLPPTLPSP